MPFCVNSTRHAALTPFPCHSVLIHTCHAAPLPFSDSAVSFVKVHMVAGNIWKASPTLERIGKLLITNCVELRVVAGRSWMWAGHPHAVSGWPMLIHICHAHAVLRRGLMKSLLERHGRGMACVNHTWPHCVNQMGKIHSKPLDAWHGRGTAG
jgi:hypothetical protein